jgi:BlaI family penicillinase repressor
MGGKRRAALAKSELTVMQILWRLKAASVREVQETLSKDGPVDFWTVQTYLRRLQRKGYVRVRRDGRKNVYKAAVRERDAIGEIVDDFVKRLFDGAALPLLQHFVERQPLTSTEIDQLQRYLDDLKRGAK